MGWTKRLVACCLFIFALAATIIFVVGFATSHWEEQFREHNGLWEKCHGDICSPYRSKDIGGWMAGVQTLECFGLIGMVIMLMLSSMLACGLPVPKEIITKIVLILCAMSSCFIGLGVIIFSIKCQLPLDYSFILAAVSTVLTVCVAGLAFALRKLSEW